MAVDGGRDLEGSSCGLIEVLFWHLSGGTENPCPPQKKLNYNSQCLIHDLN
jgi:hypothetical protein